MELHVDIIHEILFLAEKSSAVDGFRFARIDRRRYKIFCQKSLDTRLSKLGQALRFLRENLDKLNWDMISLNPSIPIEFYRENIDKLDWWGISFNPSIPIEFYRENIDEVNWAVISRNKFVPVRK